MSDYIEYRIGRREADIVIDDAGVSKLHAELIAVSDGTFFLTDCASTSGTYVDRNGEWCRIRQGFIEPHDRLLFGKKMYTPLQLLSAMTGGEGGKAKQNKTSSRHALDGTAPTDPKDKLPQGKVKRDPISGNIISVDTD